MPYSQLTWLAAAPVGQEESYRQLHYSKNNFCPRRSGHGSGVGHKRVEHVLLLEFTVAASVGVAASVDVAAPPSRRRTIFPSMWESSDFECQCSDCQFSSSRTLKMKRQSARANRINYTSIYHRMYFYKAYLPIFPHLPHCDFTSGMDWAGPLDRSRN